MNWLLDCPLHSLYVYVDLKYMVTASIELIICKSGV